MCVQDTRGVVGQGSKKRAHQGVAACDEDMTRIARRSVGGDGCKQSEDETARILVCNDADTTRILDDAETTRIVVCNAR